jgi:hypothetical protein
VTGSSHNSFFYWIISIAFQPPGQNQTGTCFCFEFCHNTDSNKLRYCLSRESSLPYITIDYVETVIPAVTVMFRGNLNFNTLFWWALSFIFTAIFLYFSVMDVWLHHISFFDC